MVPVSVAPVQVPATWCQHHLINDVHTLSQHRCSVCNSSLCSDQVTEFSLSDIIVVSLYVLFSSLSQVGLGEDRTGKLGVYHN